MNRIKLLQFNVLADGLSQDGFLCTNTFETKNGNEISSQQVLSDIQNANGDETKLKEISNMLDTPKNVASSDYILNWQNRWKMILNSIKQNEPDIIVFQEMDRYDEVLKELKTFGYLSTNDFNDLNNVSYVPMWKNPTANNETYLDILRNQEFAFIPKLGSKARHYSLKRGNVDPDNDGCAIFWKNRFSLKNLEFKQFSKFNSNVKDTDGALAVVLLDKISGLDICVITSHLPSGQTRERELERLELLIDSEKGVFRTFIVDMMNRVDRVIIALDANSDPSEPLVEIVPGKTSNVWSEFLSIPHLSSVWKEIIHLKPVTVNKIRGPNSNQLQKIGVHSYELIDHVFYSDAIKFIGFSEGCHPHIFKSKEEALRNITPNVSDPSDHYPVFVDFDLS